MSAPDLLQGWPHVFLPGESDAPVLLTLHGTGSNEQEIATLAPRLDPRSGVLSPRGLVREHGAALHRAAVQQDRVRAALARVAADVRSGQPEAVAERVHEQRSTFDLERAWLAVDDERDHLRKTGIRSRRFRSRENP